MFYFPEGIAEKKQRKEKKKAKIGRFLTGVTNLLYLMFMRSIFCTYITNLLVELN